MLLSFCFLFVCFSASEASALSLKRIGSFNQPTYLTTAGDKRLFITERAGVIKTVRKGKIRTFLSIKNLVGTRSESGLLSMVFDDRFKKNRKFYVYYVDKNQTIRVDQFKAKKKNSHRKTKRTRINIISIPGPPDTHKGGQINMINGYLMFGTGDGGDYKNPGKQSQNKNSLLGKLIRIKPFPTKGRRPNFRPHPDNPFVRKSGRSSIFALGLRNPWRWSFDAKYPNQILLSDVGHSRFEELNRGSIQAWTGGNFGWPCFEAKKKMLSCASRSFIRPSYVYSHRGGRCSITGGYVNRSKVLPRYGAYFYGDFCTGEIRTLRSGKSRGTGLRVSQLVSFGEDSRNNLYAVSLNGPVYKLVR